MFIMITYVNKCFELVDTAQWGPVENKTVGETIHGTSFHGLSTDFITLMDVGFKSSRS
jgi:hypothetical protein